MWSTLAKTVAGFLAPTTVLTGLLLYFGFAYTDALYEYFGIDVATMGFSTQDYLLRSAGALYIPVGAGLLAALAGILGYYWAAGAGASRAGLGRHLGRAGLVLVVCGLGLFTLGMLGGFQVWPAGALDTPLLLGGGLLLVLYGRLFRLKARGQDYPVAREAGALAVAAALVVLSAFWAANVYAQNHGRSDAAYLAANLDLRPEVVVDTTERLYVQQSGVTETELPDDREGQHLRYRYEHLRLLAQSGARMFVVPMGWRTNGGVVLVLSAGPDVRVAFRRG
jgi:hypothetical protein